MTIYNAEFPRVHKTKPYLFRIVDENADVSTNVVLRHLFERMESHPEELKFICPNTKISFLHYLILFWGVHRRWMNEHSWLLYRRTEGAPKEVIDCVLRLAPSLIYHVDVYGCYPLHYASMHHFCISVETFEILLSAYPEAAHCMVLDKEGSHHGERSVGRFPLQLSTIRPFRDKVAMFEDMLFTTQFEDVAKGKLLQKLTVTLSSRQSQIIGMLLTENPSALIFTEFGDVAWYIMSGWECFRILPEHYRQTLKFLTKSIFYSVYLCARRDKGKEFSLLSFAVHQVFIKNFFRSDNIFFGKNSELRRFLLDECKDEIFRCLHLALSIEKRWERGIGDIVRCNPSAVNQRDSLTHMLPFMIAATKQNVCSSVDEREMLSTTFELMKMTDPNYFM